MVAVRKATRKATKAEKDAAHADHTTAAAIDRAVRARGAFEAIDVDPEFDTLGPEARRVVFGWRFDILSPWGWIRPHGVTSRLLGDEDQMGPLGFFLAERATCLVSGKHPAPHPECVCGLHAAEFLTEGLAEAVERLEADLDRQPLIDGIHPRTRLGIVLSRVRLETVIGGAWYKREIPEGAYPDPPATLRARRRRYVGTAFTDREEIAEHAPRFLRPLHFEYAPSIPALIREHVGNDAALIRQPVEEVG